MATSAGEKIAELNEKFLTCEVCTESYKRPKNLPCGHTFCQECLENWAKVNRGKELTCPNCRQPWQVPVGGVEKLPTNYRLKGMIESLAKSEETKKTNIGNSKMCELCENKEATSACLECSQLICNDCNKGHKRMKLTAGHRVVSLDDYRANYENQPAKLKPSECERHPGIQLKYYCQTCSSPTCLECTIIEHPVPQHKHVYLSEAAKDCRDSIGKRLIEVRSKLKYYNEKKVDIRKVKEDLKKNLDKTTIDIETHTEKLVKKIRESEKKMKRMANEIYEAKTIVLDSQLDRIELATGQVTNLLEYSKSLVEVGTDAGLMSAQKQNQEMLEGILTEEIQVEPQVDHHLQYLSNPDFATGQLGSVIDSHKAVASKSLITPTKPFTHDLNASFSGQPVKNRPIKINYLPLQTTKVIGSQGEGPGRFRWPRGVAVSKVSGDIYVADGDNCRIQVFDSHGEYKRHFTVSVSGEKVWPCGVAFTREDHLVITKFDSNGNQVCVCDTDGKLLRQFGKGELKGPWDVAISSDGHLHVVDNNGHCVKTFTLEGALVRTIGNEGDQPGQFKYPWSVAVNSKDQIIVSDAGNHRVQVFDSSGAFLFTCGKKGEGEGELQNPLGVTVDQYDNIIVCDQGGNRRIQMFSAEGDYIGRVDDPRDGVTLFLFLTTVPGQPLKLIVTVGNYQMRIMEIKKS